ncbi:hypothetical protein [Neobacillus vireti]|nr:hypothetical protein [Neobacillus vireti]
MKKAIIVLFSLALLVCAAPVNDANPVNVADSTQDHPIYPPV